MALTGKLGVRWGCPLSRQFPWSVATGEVTQYPWELLLRPSPGPDCRAIRAGSVSRSPAVDDSITAARYRTGRRTVRPSIGDN
jgi:hypothetical protein